MRSNVVKTAVKRSENTYQTEEYKYDNMGHMLAYINQGDMVPSVTQYEYDTAGRVIKMIAGLAAYNPNTAKGVVTSYSYNAQGYLSEIVDPMGLTETYDSYDYAGNLLKMTDKNGNILHNIYGTYGLGKTYFESSPETKEYSYNKLGQLTNTKAVNADGQSIEESYQHDAFGRLVSSTANDGSVQNYAYDSNSNLISYEFIKDEEVKNSAAYEYNNLNRLTSLTSNGIITSYIYDNVGNLTRKSLNSGVTVNYTYNKAGLMTRNESKKGSNVYTYSDCTYLLNGLMQSVTMPSDNGSSTKVKNYQYDGAGHLKGEYVKNGSEVIVNSQYYYDTRGNRFCEISIDGLFDYYYDSNNRLTSKRDPNGSSYTHYYYDNNGNLTAKQESDINIARGNASISGRSSDTGLSIYRYDAFNRLIKYNSGSAEASYIYNVDNLRAGKTVNREKTDFVWNGQNLAMESGNNSVNMYTYDMTGIHIANKNGTVNSYLKDHHGNIAGYADASGRMIQDAWERMDYDAFGNQWNGNLPDPFGYCGEYYDNESGLIYLRNRYYDSTDSRFITEDPYWDVINMIYGDKYDNEINLLIYYDTYLNDNNMFVPLYNYNINFSKYICYNKQNNINNNAYHNNIVNIKLYETGLSGITIDLNDNLKHDDEIYFVDIQQRPSKDVILQSSNLYIYALNNPINYTDATGQFVAEAAIATSPEWVPYVIAAGGAAVSIGVTYYKEHTSNKRKSTLNKHQAGQSRKKKDAGGEKGDARRKSRSNKRRP